MDCSQEAPEAEAAPQIQLPAPPAAPAPPATPEPPRFEAWACPEGWSPRAALGGDDVERVFGEVVVCEPTLPRECPSGTMALPGEAACVRVGAACPEGDAWPDEGALRARAGAAFEQGRVIYVSPEGRGRSGSREAPLGLLADALESANSGDVVAVGVGRYDESVTIPAGVAVIGACATGTTVRSPDGAQVRSTVYMNRPSGALVRDLTVQGSRMGIFILNPSSASVVDVAVEGAEGVGIAIEGRGAVELEGVVVRDMAPDANDLGVGLSVIGAGLEVRLSRGWFSRSYGAAISVFEGAALEAEALALVDTQTDRRGNLGSGMWVQDGARATLRRVVMERNTSHGLLVLSGTADVEELVVRDTAPDASGQLGNGVLVYGQGQLEGRRLVLSRNHHRGLHVEEQGSRLGVTGCLVEDTVKPAGATSAQGALALLGGALELRGCALSGSDESGVVVQGDGSTATLEDVAILDTRAGDERLGRGLVVQVGGDALLKRGLVARSLDTGVFVAEGGRLIAEDLTVAETLGQEGDPGAGRGINAQRGGRLELTRGWVEGSRSGGVFVGGIAASATLEDLTITRTRVTSDGLAALEIQNAVEVTLRRVKVLDSERVAVMFGPYAQVDAEDLCVAMTREVDDLAAGLRVGGARATVRRLQVDPGHIYGVLVGAPDYETELTLEDGVVSGPAVGIAALFGRESVLKRVRIDAFSFGGLLLGEGAVVRAEDLHVADGTAVVLERGYDLPGHFGRGVEVYSGARLTVERGLIERSYEAGVHVFGAGSVATLTDVTVRETRLSACAPECRYADHPGATFGTGIIVRERGSLDMSRFSIHNSELVGIHLAGVDDASIRDGEVHDNIIGINVDDDVTLSDVFQDVLVYRNEVDIDVSRIALPEAKDVVERARWVGAEASADGER